MKNGHYGAYNATMLRETGVLKAFIYRYRASRRVSQCTLATGYQRAPDLPNRPAYRPKISYLRQALIPQIPLTAHGAVGHSLPCQKHHNRQAACRLNTACNMKSPACPLARQHCGPIMKIKIKIKIKNRNPTHGEFKANQTQELDTLSCSVTCIHRVAVGVTT